MKTSMANRLGQRLLISLGAVTLLMALLGLANAQPAEAQGSVTMGLDASVSGGPLNAGTVTVVMDGPGVSIAAPGNPGINGQQGVAGSTYNLSVTVNSSGYTANWICKNQLTASGTGFAATITLPADATTADCTVFLTYKQPISATVDLQVVNTGTANMTSADFELELFTSTGAFLDSGVDSGSGWLTPVTAGSYQIGLDGLVSGATVTSAACTTTSAALGGDEPLPGTAFNVDANTSGVSCVIVVTVVGPTAVPPTATAVPPTATAVPPTATAVPPTATAVPPTATAVPPTATAVPAAATAVPPTATAVPAAATAVPATATAVPAAATAVPATATAVPAAATAVPATATAVPAAATAVPATATAVPAAATAVPPAAAPAPGLETDDAPLTLAFTGAETQWLAIAGTVLLASGLALSYTSRRREV